MVPECLFFGTNVTLFFHFFWDCPLTFCFEWTCGQSIISMLCHYLLLTSQWLFSRLREEPLTHLCPRVHFCTSTLRTSNFKTTWFFLSHLLHIQLVETLYPFAPTRTKMYVAEKWPFGPNIMTKPQKPNFGSKMWYKFGIWHEKSKKMHLGHIWVNVWGHRSKVRVITLKICLTLCSTRFKHKSYHFYLKVAKEYLVYSVM